MEGSSRTTVKERHRRAILDAAIELIEASEAPRFSTDELAERAGVSRRTVFNHFASLDDVLLSVCTETLDVVTEQLRARTSAAELGEASCETMFAALAQTLRGADLSGPIVQVWRALGGASADDQRTQAFAQRALALVANDLSAQLVDANPQVDPLEIDLLASLLTHGLGVIAGHWVATAKPGQPPSRAEWDRLLERLLDTVGSGYLPRTS